MKDITWQIINEIRELIPSNRIIDFNKLIEKMKQGEEDAQLCECVGCPNKSIYEGWWKVKDSTGVPTGLVQKKKVCENHKYLLEGN
jgi:hypothetical protein